MNKKDLEHFKTLLETELKTLESELRSAGVENPEHKGEWLARPDQMDILSADENEVADQLESYEENSSIVNNLGKRYHQVKDAIERINTGKYGICKFSGKPIEKERLEANPAAETSIAFKDKE